MSCASALVVTSMHVSHAGGVVSGQRQHGTDSEYIICSGGGDGGGSDGSEQQDRGCTHVQSHAEAVGQKQGPWSVPCRTNVGCVIK
jgi:hypothetical protein